MIGTQTDSPLNSMAAVTVMSPVYTCHAGLASGGGAITDLGVPCLYNLNDFVSSCSDV
jgi:hypothetical protein